METKAALRGVAKAMEVAIKSGSVPGLQAAFKEVFDIKESGSVPEADDGEGSALSPDVFDTISDAKMLADIIFSFSALPSAPSGSVPLPRFPN
jgi:Na+/H+-translocating membrane pyrophosphatase